MSHLRDQMQSLLDPIPLAITLLAFTLGYQAHAHFSPVIVSSGTTPTTTSTSGATLSSSSTRSASSSSKSRRASPPPSVSPSHGESEGATDSDSDADDEAAATAADLKSVRAGGDDIKLVLVVNDSLKMTKGKIGAQCGHATLACYETLAKSNPGLISKWKMHGQPKIALRCTDTDELEALAKQARALNLCARTIQDAGRTQVAPGSKTVLGIGPGPARLINQVTGKLRLL